MELMPNKGRHRKSPVITFMGKYLKNTAELDAEIACRYLGGR